MALIAQPPAALPRSPQGIYAVINIYEYTEQCQKIQNPQMTLEQYLMEQYSEPLQNPAVSGLAIWVQWSLLNPHAPGAADSYEWYWLDDAFNEVAAWNSANPGKPPKTIQLVPTPGFNSPSWLMEQIYSCNFLFSPAYPLPPLGSTCGKATFSGFKEGGVVDGTPVAKDLPMPWDPPYKSAWETFLRALASRYESNPAFVSVSVAGPTASSEEMMLPAKQNTDASATQIGGLTVNEMWDRLLKYQYAGHPKYLLGCGSQFLKTPPGSSAQVFLEEFFKNALPEKRTDLDHIAHHAFWGLHTWRNAGLMLGLKMPGLDDVLPRCWEQMEGVPDPFKHIYSNSQTLHTVLEGLRPRAATIDNALAGKQPPAATKYVQALLTARQKLAPIIDYGSSVELVRTQFPKAAGWRFANHRGVALTAVNVADDRHPVTFQNTSGNWEDGVTGDVFSPQNNMLTVPVPPHRVRLLSARNG